MIFLPLKKKNYSIAHITNCGLEMVLHIGLIHIAKVIQSSFFAVDSSASGPVNQEAGDYKRYFS